MKKLFSMLLVLVLALSAFATLAVAESEGTVRMLAAVTGGKDDEEMTLWAEALSEATGLTVTVEKPASDYDNILMQKLSAGESYDLIYIGSSQYKSLVERDPVRQRSCFRVGRPEGRRQDLRRLQQARAARSGQPEQEHARGCRH